MSKKLVIVESPIKARTISRFLGNEYLVESSFGHIRDLPERKMGINIENDFEPDYEIPDKAASIVAKLKKIASSADRVYLATDADLAIIPIIVVVTPVHQMRKGVQELHYSIMLWRLVI